MAFFLSLEGIHRRDLDTGAKDTGAKLFAALGQPVLMHGARPAWDQVHSSGPWDDPPSRQVHDASELTGAPSASVLVMPHASHQPPAPEPPQKRAGSSDAACRHGLIWDHTVFHVVRHIQRRLNHRNLAGTPAQGASITSTTTRPWPCAIQPTTRAPRQLVARLNIKHQSIWGASHAHQMEALQTDEQITPNTTVKRRTAAGRARHRPRSLKTARVEVRSSSRTSTSTRNPRPTTGHPHSTRKSPFIHYPYGHQ